MTQPDPDGPGGPLARPVTQYRYDEVGNLVRVVDPLGNATSYAYDKLNRRTVRTDALAHTQTTVYDEVGRIVEQIDELGRQTDYDYDNLDRLVQVTQPDPGTGAARPVTTYAYDATGNRTSMTDPLGQYHALRL